MRLSLSTPPAALARAINRWPALGATALALALAGCSKPPPPPAPAPPAPVVKMDPVPTAKTCAKPAEKQSFAVTGLKTRLMVAALTCGSEDQYNAFINRNRSALVKQDANLSTYFVRAYGRGKASQSQMDSYKTDLANVQQQRQSRDPQFCQVSAALFGEALAPKTPVDIGPLASNAPIDQPMTITTCN